MQEYVQVLTSRTTKSHFWHASRETCSFIFERENWKHSIAAIVALAALLGEAYIIVRAFKEGRGVHFETNGETMDLNKNSYFFWLALGIIVACGNHLIIAALATFKQAYLKTNRENNTKWLLPLFAAHVCVIGLMAGLLPAALKRDDSPSAFAAVSILSIYFQSILWAIILAWRDVTVFYNRGGPNSTAMARVPLPNTNTAQVQPPRHL